MVFILLRCSALGSWGLYSKDSSFYIIIHCILGFNTVFGIYLALYFDLNRVKVTKGLNQVFDLSLLYLYTKNKSKTWPRRFINATPGNISWIADFEISKSWAPKLQKMDQPL